MDTMVAIQSFLNNRQALNRSPKTIKWYEHNLIRFATDCPELPMEPESIEEFLARVVPNEKQDELRHAYYRSLKALYRFICKRKRLPNPIELIDSPSRRKKVKPTLKARQMMQLLSLVRSPRDKALLSVFIDTGARASEIATLRKETIYEDTIKVDGKTGQREVPISEETRQLLLALKSTDVKSEYVFLNARGRPLTRYGIYQIISGYMKQAGIDGPKVGSHRLRHGFGKNYLVNGGDLRSLQKIMGHASITTTEGYTELAIDELVAMHHKFTPLRSAHAAAQESFFDVNLVIKEAESILHSSRREDEVVCVGKTKTSGKAESRDAGATEIPSAKRMEQPVNQSNGEAKEPASVMKTSNGASKWVTPSLPGLNGM